MSIFNTMLGQSLKETAPTTWVGELRSTKLTTIFVAVETHFDPSKKIDEVSVVGELVLHATVLAFSPSYRCASSGFRMPSPLTCVPNLFPSRLCINQFEHSVFFQIIYSPPIYLKRGNVCDERIQFHFRGPVNKLDRVLPVKKPSTLFTTHFRAFIPSGFRMQFGKEPRSSY